MKKKLFIEISELLRNNAKYNLKTSSVEVNLPKIHEALNNIGIGSETSKRIEDACKLIAKDVCYSIKSNSTSFSNISDSLHTALESISRDISSTGYLQSTMFSKSDLSKTIINSGLEDSFKQRIEQKVESLFAAMQKDDLIGVGANLSALREISSSLTQYINDMKLPTWFGELFFQRVSNSAIAETNLDSIKSIEGNLDVLDDAQKQAVSNQLQKCLNEAYKVKSAMTQNNELLSKIENDIDAKRNSVKTVQKNLKKFMSTVADGVILKLLQADSKSITVEIKALDIVIQNTPQYFNEIETIDSYCERIDNMSNPLLKKFQHVLEIEQSLGIKSCYSDKIKDIQKSLDSLTSNLQIEKIKVVNCVNSPIPGEAFVWERSTWQAFKTGCANFSKFFIGNDIHTSIYGYADGVEELRRVIDDLPENCSADTLYIANA